MDEKHYLNSDTYQLPQSNNNNSNIFNPIFTNEEPTATFHSSHQYQQHIHLPPIHHPQLCDSLDEVNQNYSSEEEEEYLSNDEDPDQQQAQYHESNNNHDNLNNNNLNDNNNNNHNNITQHQFIHPSQYQHHAANISSSSPPRAISPPFTPPQPAQIYFAPHQHPGVATTLITPPGCETSQSVVSIATISMGSPSSSNVIHSNPAYYIYAPQSPPTPHLPQIHHQQLLLQQQHQQQLHQQQQYYIYQQQQQQQYLHHQQQLHNQQQLLLQQQHHQQLQHQQQQQPQQQTINTLSPPSTPSSQFDEPPTTKHSIPKSSIKKRSRTSSNDLKKPNVPIINQLPLIQPSSSPTTPSAPSTPRTPRSTLSTTIPVDPKNPLLKQNLMVVSLTDAQKNIYRNLLKSTIPKLNQNKSEQDQASFLTDLYSLLMDCINHPGLLPQENSQANKDQLVQSSGKLLALEKIVNNNLTFLTGKARIIILSSSNSTLDLIENYFTSRSISIIKVNQIPNSNSTTNDNDKPPKKSLKKKKKTSPKKSSKKVKRVQKKKVNDDETEEESEDQIEKLEEIETIMGDTSASSSSTSTTKIFLSTFNQLGQCCPILQDDIVIEFDHYWQYKGDKDTHTVLSHFTTPPNATYYTLIGKDTVEEWVYTVYTPSITSASSETATKPNKDILIDMIKYSILKLTSNSNPSSPSSTINNSPLKTPIQLSISSPDLALISPRSPSITTSTSQSMPNLGQLVHSGSSFNSSPPMTATSSTTSTPITTSPSVSSPQLEASILSHLPLDYDPWKKSNTTTVPDVTTSPNLISGSRRRAPPRRNKQYGDQTCFSCKSHEDDKGRTGVIQCRSCPMIFHRSCANLNHTPRSWKCPRHVCRECKKTPNAAGGSFFFCKDCPSSFCINCLPEDITILQKHEYTEVKMKYPHQQQLDEDDNNNNNSDNNNNNNNNANDTSANNPATVAKKGKGRPIVFILCKRCPKLNESTRSSTAISSDAIDKIASPEAHVDDMGDESDQDTSSNSSSPPTISIVEK